MNGHTEEKLELDKRVETLEAGLLNQEHRLFHVFYNFFYKTKDLPLDNQKRIATVRALIWNCVKLFTPASPVFASIVGLLALVVSWYNFSAILSQNEIIKSQRELETHTLLINHNSRLLELLSENPEQRKYFYENAQLPETGEERDRALIYAEMWTDMFEQVMIQRVNIAPSNEPTWKKYAKDMYDSSSAIQVYFSDAEEWYVPSLRELWDGESEADNNQISEDVLH